MGQGKHEAFPPGEEVLLGQGEHETLPATSLYVPVHQHACTRTFTTQHSEAWPHTQVAHTHTLMAHTHTEITPLRSSPAPQAKHGPLVQLQFPQLQSTPFVEQSTPFVEHQGTLPLSIVVQL